MGGKIDYQLIQGRGPYAFRIPGTNYHRIGSLVPIEGEHPKFAQLYIYDTKNEVANRISAIHDDQIGAELDPNIIHDLQMMLNQINPYAKVFRYARDLLPPNRRIELRMQILEQRGPNQRQYNKPSCSEVAALMVGDGSQSTNRRDVIVSTLDNRLKRIDETHPCYMPLQYPLLFPHGEDGWKLDIPYQCVPRARSQRQRMVTLRDFTAYRIQNRLNEGKTLLQGGRAFQQYLVDYYAAIEDDCLRYYKSNQKQLRSEVYRGIQDAINVGDTNASLIGRRYIFTSSFTGGHLSNIRPSRFIHNIYSKPAMA
uniref:Helitron helicase-like domain-containing protein n=1 Tax=Nelumbo nucifera TaxID=4432 RepID=A0A822XI75_NELNU|nr:TPA_asm: hypothetical protein HUJ06_021135 [Nelumbo nucifera]